MNSLTAETKRKFCVSIMPLGPFDPSKDPDRDPFLRIEIGSTILKYKIRIVIEIGSKPCSFNPQVGGESVEIYVD